MGMTQLEASIAFAQNVITSGRQTTRNFDSCFEWHGSHAVAIAFHRKVEKRPHTKLAQNLYKYLSRDAVQDSVDKYGHWDDLEALCEHLKEMGHIRSNLIGQGVHPQIAEMATMPLPQSTIDELCEFPKGGLSPESLQKATDILHKAKTEHALKLLDEIKILDTSHWSQPSDRTAIKVQELEANYEALTGEPCPAWPKREQSSGDAQ